MKVVGLKATYEQQEDCCGRPQHDSQTIDIEIVDGGGGPYAVISTERWSLDSSSLDEFVAEIKRRIAEVPDD